MRRRRFSEKEAIKTLILQGLTISCYRCCAPFNISDIIEREHILEMALGGSDTPDNCCYSHSECHFRITNGTKATSAGSSKHRIAKVKRLEGGGRKRKGPKIRSRPFQKKSRPFPKKLLPKPSP